jgi:hypothetical protein
VRDGKISQRAKDERLMHGGKRNAHIEKQGAAKRPRSLFKDQTNLDGRQASDQRNGSFSAW